MTALYPYNYKPVYVNAEKDPMRGRDSCGFQLNADVENPLILRKTLLIDLCKYDKDSMTI